MRYTIGKQYLFVNLNKKIEYVVLTCKEHHKVPISFYEEKQADGFIFEDENNKKWFNQYSETNYSQLNTCLDYIVFTKTEDFNKIENPYEAVIMGLINSYLDVKIALEHLKRFIRRFHNDSEIHQKKLTELISLVKKVLGKDVTFKTLSIKGNNGEIKEYPEIQVVIIN